MTSLVTAGARSRAFMTPYAFLLPALVVTAAVILFPVLQTAWMSLHDFVLFRPRDVPFIGLGNFERMWNDEVFWISLGHSFLWIALVVGFQFLLGLGAALLLNQSFWWRGLARSLVVVPWALPSVIIGLMWTWMYDFNVGVINDGLIRLGLISEPVAWLARPDTAFYAVIVALIWQGFPFFAVVVLAGLQTIPAELYEAAEIDGAGWWRKLVHITLPSLSPVIYFTLIVGVIGVLQVFTPAYIIGGGPSGGTAGMPARSTLFYTLYLWAQAFEWTRMGYACAMAWLLFVIIVILTLLAHRLVRRRITYLGE